MDIREAKATTERESVFIWESGTESWCLHDAG
jgi:hypothetical protein